MRRTIFRNARGFTLIELLVVIAIIGLLATLILVALRAARLRARDARIQGNIAQAVTTCELRNDSAGNYGGCILADGGEAVAPGAIARLVADTATIGGTLSIAPTAPTTDYCVLAALATTGQASCRDSQGISSQPGGSTTAVCSTVGVCTP